MRMTLSRQLTINVPLITTPTHALEPIVVSHRIRWYILIGNRDGHNSELRCSLPVAPAGSIAFSRSRWYIPQSRDAYFLGGPEIPEEKRGTNWKLPSYRSAAVYDRVANMGLLRRSHINAYNESLGASRF